jgi:formylglycine-generating enzyme required for sulfatase activity
MIALMYQHMQETPDLEPLPKAEQQVIFRALSKQPEDRFPSCLEFMRELERAQLPRAQAVSDPLLPSMRGSGALKDMPSTTDPIIAVSLSIQGETPRRRRALGWIGALLAITIAVTLAWTLLHSTPSGTSPSTTAQVAAEVDWLPQGIEKGDGAEVMVVDGKRFYNRIVKVQGERPIAFRLIPRQVESDPPTFYMMENKVDNALFIQASQDAAFQTLLERFQKSHPWTVKGDWKLGGLAGGKDLGISNGQLPVLRVTVIEAYCLCRWLGGNLPTAQQWDKAGGRFNGAEGPFQPPEQPGQIAVGLGNSGPLPVERKLCEVSQFGCRDMAGNGLEWTRNLTYENSLTVPVQDPKPDLGVVMRGRNYVQPKPLLFADLIRADSRSYEEVNPFISFRVVLELSLLK